MTNQSLVAPNRDLYLQDPVTTVDQALERMQQITSDIEACQPRGAADGVACFNYLYTTITQRVRDGISKGYFQDAEFLTQLDISFANRYFNALRASVVDESTVPRSWDVLIERRSDDRIQSIQFAMAGVNAHVNFDLALAVIETCKAIRRDPNSGTQHSDYQKVNQIFAEEMQTLRQHFENECARAIDGAASGVLNLVGDWSVEAARDAAWEVAEHLWTIQRIGIGEQAVVNRLDRMAALSGHLLLTPLK